MFHFFFTCDVSSREDGQQRDHNEAHVRHSEDKEHVRHAFVHFVGELAVDGDRIVWVYDFGTDDSKNKRTDAEASYDDPTDEAGPGWEPEPAVVHRHHVSEPVADAIANREETEEEVESAVNENRCENHREADCGAN